MMTDLKTPRQILLYPCNIVGYIRLIWLFATIGTVALYQLNGLEPSFWLRFWLSIGLLIDILLLDILDGYLARKYGHVTKFGAVFELTIDLLSHTVLWVLSGLAIGPLFMAIEWTTGLLIAIFSFMPDNAWKTILSEQGPWFARVYFARSGGVNIINNYGNAGHLVFPLAYFTFQTFTPLHIVALPGLLMFEIVSLYMIYTFVKLLLEMERDNV